MTPHDIFTMNSAKAVEYLLAVAFLLLFTLFWRFLNAERVAEPVAAAEVPSWPGRIVDWFLVPDQIYFHPGHAWAKVGDGGLVRVGMDDFAQKLMGRVAAVALPEVGSRVGQGETGWSLESDSKSVAMLSPVDGMVVAVNHEVVSSSEILNRDPYGAGWLLTVRAPRLAANLKQLVSGRLARRWMEEVCANVRAMMSGDLGLVYQDGGLPVEGMARNLGRENWDQVARAFFLT